MVSGHSGEGGQGTQQTCDEDGGSLSLLEPAHRIPLSSSLNEVLYPHCLEQCLVARRCSMMICRVEARVNE